MPGPLPDSYRRLAAFSSRLASGTRLYDQGSLPERFYVVLRGEVLFEVVSEDGETEVVASAQPGDLVGHVAAFTRRPTSAAARVDRESVLLSIPLARLTEAVREAPELGIQLVYAFAGVEPPRADAGDGPGEVLAPSEQVAPEPATPALSGGIVAVGEEFDPDLFFVDTATCPVSGTEFQFLRVRTRAVRPRDRESDFHVRYQGINPTWYGVVICPGCAFAAYLDDFNSLEEHTRGVLWDDRDARVALAGGPLNGVREEGDAVTALELAIRCYELRGASDSRRAVLQQRRAWLERERGSGATERIWLTRARESFQRAFEADSRLSEEAAARIAYLVGDLSSRLGDLPGAAQWLETAVRVAPETSAGIVRTARERLQDVRQQIKQARLAS